MDHVPSPEGDAADEGIWPRELTPGTTISLETAAAQLDPQPSALQMCAAPFAGIGGLVLPMFGHARWPKNPNYCKGLLQIPRAGGRLSGSVGPGE